MKRSLAILDASKMGDGTMGKLEAAKKSSATSTRPGGGGYRSIGCDMLVKAQMLWTVV